MKFSFNGEIRCIQDFVAKAKPHWFKFEDFEAFLKEEDFGSCPDLENRFSQDFRKDFGARMNKNGNIHRE